MATKKKAPKKPKFTAMIDIKGYVEIEFRATNFKEAIEIAEQVCLAEYFKPKGPNDGGHIEEQEVIGIWAE